MRQTIDINKGSWLRWLLGVWAGLVLLNPAWAQSDDASRTITAVRLAPGESITLDGSLSHPAWGRAPVWSRFIEKEPRTGAEPPQETRVQVLFDERALYVGVTLNDRDPSRIRDLPVRYDQVNRTQDFVVVYIDAIGTKRSAQFFRVNAAGSMGDGIHTAADDSEDFSPDFDWDSAVQRTAQGWTTVMRLPFASLRYADGARQTWRMMVARRLPRDDFHLIASVPIPRDVPSFIHNLQPLAGVSLPQSQQFLTLRPSLTLRTTRSEEVGQPRQSKTEVDASLDVKWRPRAELVVDATLNPDFSQVALDVPQLAGNSRFALFFPEKRPFFFESADLLRTPTEALYTRSFTAPRWGLRGTWRSASLAGSVLAVDDRGGGLVLLPGPYGTDAAEQPASRTVATRIKGDEGHFTWGGVLAARHYARGVGDNNVLGPDALWQINDTWRLRGQWLASDTTAQPDGNGSLVRGSASRGQRRLLKFLRNADFSESNFGIDDIDTGFRHDSGFVKPGRRAHVLRVPQPGLGRRRALQPVLPQPDGRAQHRPRHRQSGQGVAAPGLVEHRQEQSRVVGRCQPAVQRAHLGQLALAARAQRGDRPGDDARGLVAAGRYQCHAGPAGRCQCSPGAQGRTLEFQLALSPAAALGNRTQLLAGLVRKRRPARLSRDGLATAGGVAPGARHEPARDPAAQQPGPPRRARRGRRARRQPRQLANLDLAALGRHGALRRRQRQHQRQAGDPARQRSLRQATGRRRRSARHVVRRGSCWWL